MLFTPKQCAYRQRQVALWRAEHEERALAASADEALEELEFAEAGAHTKTLAEYEKWIAELEQLYDEAWEELSAAEQREMIRWQKAQATAQLLLPFPSEDSCPTTS